jgi:hypothetical protein
MVSEALAAAYGPIDIRSRVHWSRRWVGRSWVRRRDNVIPVLVESSHLSCRRVIIPKPLASSTPHEHIKVWIPKPNIIRNDRVHVACKRNRLNGVGGTGTGVGGAGESDVERAQAGTEGSGTTGESPSGAGPGDKPVIGPWLDTRNFACF